MTFINPCIPAELDWISKEYNKRDEKGLFKLVPIHALARVMVKQENHGEG